MNKLLSTLLALIVASATGFAHAQAPAAAPAANAKPPAEAPSKQSAPAGAASLQAKIAMCLGCHNIIGYQASFPEVYKVPKIAGQNAAYIEAALAGYKTGDRKHPTMRGIADALSEQDIKDIAGYYSKLGLEDGSKLGDKPDQQPGPEVAALLQKAACVSCHGANFSKPIAPNYPKLAGQNSDYLFVALKAYKAGSSGAVGRNNAIMGGIAKQFTNNELKAVAQYIGSLDGDVKTVPESRFHSHKAD